MDNQSPAQNKVQQIPVQSQEAGMRLDRFIGAKCPDVPRTRLHKAIRQGEVRVDGRRTKAATRIEEGQIIRLPPFANSPKSSSEARVQKQLSLSHPLVQQLKNRILLVNEDLVALDKPAGLAVQGGSGQKLPLTSALPALTLLINEQSSDRPSDDTLRLVHRLDLATGGVLLLARTRQAATRLTAAFSQRRMVKIYWAVTEGVPNPVEGTIRLALKKTSRLKDTGGPDMYPTDSGPPARTDYRVLDQVGTSLALVELRPHTGRTHQIRAHLQAIGTPIVGDSRYGNPESTMTNESGLHLYARALYIPDGIAGAGQWISTQPPDHFGATLKSYGLGDEPDY